MFFENLSDELKDKVRSAKTPEDLAEIAEEEGIELSDEMLEAVSGGQGHPDDNDYCDTLYCDLACSNLNCNQYQGGDYDDQCMAFKCASYSDPIPIFF